MKLSRTRPTALLPVIALLSLALVGLGLTGCGGGGGGGGEQGVGGVFRVVTADALPNGRLLPADSDPSTENQFLRIEFSKSVDPGSLFDSTTSNGLASAIRLINHFYLGTVSPQQPPDYQTPQLRRRLEGFLVWNGQTNFDSATGTYKSQLQPIAPQQLGIGLANYQVATNIVYFIADKDANPATADSFLPSDLATAALRASQVQVDCQTSIKSLRGEFLSEVFGESFNVGDRDWILPMIDSVEPAPDQTDVDVNASIVIRFTEPVESSTASVAPPTGPLPAGVNLLVEALVTGPNGPQSLRIAGSTTPTSGSTFDIVFTPQAQFPGNTPIKVTITPGSSNYLDLANNPLAQSAVTDGNYSFTTGSGPQVANNPVAPWVVHFITQNSQIGAIETNGWDDVRELYEDFYFPIDEKGNLRYPYPGGLLDLEIGPFIAPYFQVPGASSYNVIGNPPLQRQYYLGLGLIQGNAPRPITNPPPDIHLWTPPGTESDLGFCQLFQPFAPPVQPLGNFLFVSNEEKDVVHVINSNTYQHFKDMPTPDPHGLAVNPILSFLFVTNFGGGSVSVLDLASDAKTHLPKGTIVATIPTGLGPDAITVDPNGESIYVVNRLENSVSVIQMNKINSAEPVRVKVTGNVGPACIDVCATGRIPPLPPWFPNLPSYAYFCNLGADNISVFESGPQQINGYGRDNIIQVIGGFPTPTSVNTDEMSAATASMHEPIPPASSLTGCWVTCSDGTVKHLRATRFKYTNFPNPPPAWIGVEYSIKTTVKVGARPQDVVLRDPFVPCQTNNNKHAPDLPGSGAAQVPSRMYVVNGDGSVSVVELNNGRTVVELPGIGVRKMAAYYTN